MDSWFSRPWTPSICPPRCLLCCPWTQLVLFSKINQLIKQPSKHPTNQPFNLSFNQPTNQPSKHPANHPTNHINNQPTISASNLSYKHSTNQLTSNHPSTVSHLTNQGNFIFKKTFLMLWRKNEEFIIKRKVFPTLFDSFNTKTLSFSCKNNFPLFSEKKS